MNNRKHPNPHVEVFDKQEDHEQEEHVPNPTPKTDITLPKPKRKRCKRRPMPYYPRRRVVGLELLPPTGIVC